MLYHLFLALRKSNASGVIFFFLFLLRFSNFLGITAPEPLARTVCLAAGRVADGFIAPFCEFQALFPCVQSFDLATKPVALFVGAA